jgi:radical SAM superfamily enzyme YgiQ (UPF0313 family)
MVVLAWDQSYTQLVDLTTALADHAGGPPAATAQIALINMPFGAVDIPSIALAQLDAVIASRLAGRVASRVLHLNLDFVPLLGLDLCNIVAGAVEANTAGLGDWIFKRAAFPAMPDDPEAYLLRHFSANRAHLDLFRRELVGKREAIDGFLDQLIERYQLADQALVGFTSMFSQNLASFALARKLKQRNPALITVMGGANCEAPMGAVIARQVEWIDFVFSGPALRSFPEFLELLLAGRRDDCHQLRGVLSRRKLAAMAQPAAAMTAGGAGATGGAAAGGDAATVAAAPPAPPAPGNGGGMREIGEELDIDTPVRLDYDGYLEELDEKLPGLPIEPKIPFETSRGCWWGERSHCTFCGLNGATMSYRAMGAAHALAVLHDLFDRYAERAAEFRSVDNILPREYLTEVLPHLRPPEHVSLFYEIKADLREREVAVLAQARVTRIQPGIEALASSTLKLMRKGTTSFQNVRFLKHCLRYGIDALWNLLVGFPNEPEEVYEKYCRDLPLLVHLPPPSGAFPVRFDRFSPYHALAREYGLPLRPCDFYAMIYPFDRRELEDLAYFFVDARPDAPYAMSTARWLGRLREGVERWRSRWFQRDGGARPELVMRQRGGRQVVLDSRSGRVVEHALEPLALALLADLDRQQRAEQLAARHAAPAGGRDGAGGAAPADVERALAALREHGLVFEEGGMLMSLVMAPEDPSRAGRLAAGPAGVEPPGPRFGQRPTAPGSP